MATMSVLRNKIWLLLALATTVVVHVCADSDQEVIPELTIVPPGIIKQGDNITIVCKITGEMSELELIRIDRKIGSEPHEITTNDFIKEHFQNTGRYEISEYDQANHEVRLSITNIQGSDGGDIGCKHLPSDNAAYESVIIKVPPTSVEIYYLDEQGEERLAEKGENVPLKHGVDSGVICDVTVEDTEEKPTITILIDGENVTSRFADDIKFVSGHHHGLRKMTWTGIFKNLTRTPNPDENNKKLVCRAVMDEFPPVEASVNLEVSYLPQLTCEKQLFAQLGTVDKRVYCKAKMHPPPVVATWTWGKKPNRTALEVGQSDGYFIAEQENVGNDEYEFALIIPNVTLADFGRYRIETNNGIGSAEGTVKLREEITTPAPETPKPTEADTGPVKTPEAKPIGENHSNRVTAGISATFLMSLMTLAVAHLVTKS